MIEPRIEIPALMPGSWHAVIVERFELGGAILHSVTVRLGGSRALRRRWFPSRTIGLAHALEQAETFSLPLLDLGDGGGES